MDDSERELRNVYTKFGGMVTTDAERIRWAIDEIDRLRPRVAELELDQERQRNRAEELEQQNTDLQTACTLAATSQKHRKGRIEALEGALRPALEILDKMTLAFPGAESVSAAASRIHAALNVLGKGSHDPDVGDAANERLIRERDSARRDQEISNRATEEWMQLQSEEREYAEKVEADNEVMQDVLRELEQRTRVDGDMADKAVNDFVLSVMAGDSQDGKPADQRAEDVSEKFVCDVAKATNLTPERIKEILDNMVPTLRDYDDSMRGWGRNRAKDIHTADTEESPIQSSDEPDDPDLVKHMCPSRSPHHPVLSEYDVWRVLPNGDHVCSFCGSWKPEQMMEFLETVDGMERYCDLADRRHKVYIHRPEVKNASEGAIKFYIRHDDSEEMVNAINVALATSRERERERLDLLMAKVREGEKG